MEWCAVGTAVTDAMLLLGTDCLAWHRTLMCQHERKPATRCAKFVP